MLSYNVLASVSGLPQAGHWHRASGSSEGALHADGCSYPVGRLGSDWLTGCYPKLTSHMHPARVPAETQLQPAEIVIQQAMWQSVLFAEKPRRSQILELRAHWPLTPLRLNVHRNQPFEFVESVLNAYLSFAGFSLDVHYGDYDDSLSFADHREADVELIWLDFDRYVHDMGGDDLAEWCVQRVATLRGRSAAPILVADYPSTDSRFTHLNSSLRWRLDAISGLRMCPQSSIAKSLQERYRDHRAAVITGTTMSDLACVYTARALGLQWIPAVVRPMIKAIAVDLDGTLYSGVLGEDGARRVQISPAHRRLQARLLELRDRGVFLALVSRNETADVFSLFAQPTDMLIKLADFSVVGISWEAKSSAVLNAARQLNIATDTVLFIDDNPGELAEVASHCAGVRCIHAADPDTTERALSMYPGCFTFEVGSTDVLRVADMNATEARRAVAASSQDQLSYFRSLGVRLEFAADSSATVSRLHDLSIKTNQFNTGLMRLSEAGVASYVHDFDKCAVAVALQDRLAKSGIIAALFIHRENDRAVVDEIAISCRALGRSVEEPIILRALQHAAQHLGTTAYTIRWAGGPRNEPARLWLSRALNADVTVDGYYEWDDYQAPMESALTLPIQIDWAVE